MRDAGASPALVAAAASGREAVRAAALQALGEMPGPARAGRAAARRSRTTARSCASRRCSPSAGCASPSRRRCCIPLLQDDDPRLRFAAVRALGQIRNADAVPHLLPAPRRRAQGAALRRRRGARPDPRARRRCGRCVEALRDGDRNLRRAAAEGARRDRRPAGGGRAARGARGRALERALRGSVGPRPARQPEGDRRAARPRVDDADATVRRAAASALGEVGDAPRDRPARRRARRSRAAGGRRRGAAAARRLRAAGDGARVRLGRASTRRCGSSSSTSPAASRTPPRGGCCWPGSRDPAAAVRAEAAAALGDGGFRDALRAAARAEERATPRRRCGRPRRAPCGSCSPGEVPLGRPRRRAERGGVPPPARLRPRALRPLLRRVAAREPARAARPAPRPPRPRSRSRTTTATCASPPTGPRSSSGW